MIVHIADLNALDPNCKGSTGEGEDTGREILAWSPDYDFEKSDLVPLETTGGLNSVAVRFPSDPIAAESLFCRQGDTWQRQVQILPDGQARLQHSMLRRT